MERALGRIEGRLDSLEKLGTERHATLLTANIELKDEMTLLVKELRGLTLWKTRVATTAAIAGGGASVICTALFEYLMRGH